MADVPFVEGKEILCLCGSKLDLIQSDIGDMYVHCTDCGLTASGDNVGRALAEFLVAYLKEFKYHPGYDITPEFLEYSGILAAELSETEYKSFTDWVPVLLSNAGLIMPLDDPGPIGYIGGFTCPCGWGLTVSVDPADGLFTASCSECSVSSHPSIDLPTALWGYLVAYRDGDADAWCDIASKFLRDCEQRMRKEEYDRLFDMATDTSAALAPPPKQDYSDIHIEFIRSLLADTDTEERKEIMSKDVNPEVTNTQALIIKKCDELKELLLEKNRKYGDSAINPCRVFSRASATEQILVRMDDKINRIKNRQNDEDEDVIKDLAGYCILYMIAKEKESE
jgi:hypothetical protein